MRSSGPSSTRTSALDKPRPISFADRADAARSYGRVHGCSVRGGWIYDSSGGRLARGWDALAALLIERGAILLDGARFTVAIEEESAPASLEITASDRGWDLRRGGEVLAGGPLAGPRRSDDELRTLIRERLQEGRIASLVDERERWNGLAAEITAHTPIVRVPGLAQDVAPLSCLAGPTPAAAQETIAVKRPGPRPAKSSTPAPAEAPMPDLPPVPGQPVKAPPKRPRPSADREQVKALRVEGARLFLGALAHAAGGRGEEAQATIAESRNTFIQEAVVLDDEDAEQEAEQPDLSAPVPEIAEQARTLIRERSGGGPAAGQGGEAVHTALPRMAPLPPVHPRPRPPASSMKTAPRPAVAPRVATSDRGLLEMSAEEMERLSGREVIRAVAAVLQGRELGPDDNALVIFARFLRSPRRALGTSREKGMALALPEHVQAAARYAMGVGQRAGILPKGYSLAEFSVDAVWERCNVLLTQLAMFPGDNAPWHLDRKPGFMASEGGSSHLALLVR